MRAQTTHASFWALVRDQHGVISRRQLATLGFSAKAIRHRLDKGRLRRLWPDVYAVGRPEVTDEGLWMAAALTCGEGAALSHESAAALWGIRPSRGRLQEVSVPFPRDPRRRGIRTHRRRFYEVTRKRGIPVTTPGQTVIDLAARLTDRQLERVIDEADKVDLLHPQELRRMADGEPGAGAARVRRLLDRATFVLTRSDLERRFLPLATRAGLSRPRTQARVNGFDVDFYFAELGLVVETDGGRFHRTPAQQSRDRAREHAHLAAGLTPVRFTHGQVRFEPDHVERTLRELAGRYSP